MTLGITDTCHCRIVDQPLLLIVDATPWRGIDSTKENAIEKLRTIRVQVQRVAMSDER